MSRWRRAANVDAAQREIVKALNAVPGVGAAVGHDDILVGYRGRTFWFEIKSKRAMRKDGTLNARDKATTDRQKAFAAAWPGHYRIVSTLEEILGELALTCGGLRDFPPIPAGALACGQRRAAG